MNPWKQLKHSDIKKWKCKALESSWSLHGAILFNAQFNIQCILMFVCMYSVCNISSMRCNVSSPDETLRRELTVWRAAEYFWQTLRYFIWWWNTVSNAWYYFSNKMILQGEIKDAKCQSSFSSDFSTLIKH